MRAEDAVREDGAGIVLLHDVDAAGVAVFYVKPPVAQLLASAFRVAALVDLDVSIVCGLVVVAFIVVIFLRVRFGKVPKVPLVVKVAVVSKLEIVQMMGFDVFISMFSPCGEYIVSFLDDRTCGISDK